MRKARRGDLIRTFDQILRADADLLAMLKHTATDERILGSTLYLQELPIPSIVLTMGASAIVEKGDEFQWDVGIEIYAPHIFECADIVDQLEHIGRDFTQDASHIIRIMGIRLTGHEEIDAPLAGEGFAKIAAAAATMRVRWVAQ